MSDDLAQLRERTRQNRAALSDELVPAGPQSPTPPAPVTRTPVAGDAVLDRVGGRLGVVERHVWIDSEQQTLYHVRLDNGIVMIRKASELVVRPTPPEATR